MDYELTINYQFSAESGAQARDKARECVAVRPVSELVLSPLAVVNCFGNLRRKKNEQFCLLLLDTQNRIIVKETVSVGMLNASIVHPREVFRRAIEECACSIIVVHNHPSGSLEPSPEDLATTKRLVSCGQLIGIELLDHVIITANSQMSFRESGLL